MFRKQIIAVAAVAAVLFTTPALTQESPIETTIDPVQIMENIPVPTESGTVNIDGLEMYYQVHGEGEPLLLIHGGLMTIETWGPLLPALAESRKVYAIELEGHGRTVDLDRPLSLGQFADDVGGFIEQMEIGPVDIVGYSLGGITASGVGIHHPDLVKSLVIISASHQGDAIWDSVRAGWPHMTAESAEGTPMKEAYDAVAPQPERFAGLVEKVRDLLVAENVWTDEEIASIEAPVLMVVGDHDLVQMDKALETYQLLGGQASTGPMGPELNPRRQFAVVPATTHYDITYKTDFLMPVIEGFFSAQSAS